MTSSIGALGEFGLIEALTKGLKSGEDVACGIGDDCAVLNMGDRQLLLTCDASLEDIHFKRDWGTPEEIGWKAAVSALSDIAAMGGRPVAVLVSLALPEDLSSEYVKGLYRGVANAVESTGAAIVGGDTTASRSGIVIDLSVIGEVVGRSVLRSGARVGDIVAVTGAIGERGAGLDALLNGVDAPELVQAYLSPVPRIDEGRWLAGQPGVHAMMDVSDGLLPDAAHIASQSKVGIDLVGNKLPHNIVVEGYWQQRGRESAAMRLRSGEEYELLVIMGPTEAPEIMESFAVTFGLALSAVGFCTGDAGVVTVDGVVPVQGGFAHF